MIERRHHIRLRTFLGGVIAFSRRYATMDCTITNSSLDGARIALPNTAMLPDEFDLTIVRRDRSHRVQMVWRNHDAAGILFVNAPESNVVPLDWSRKLQACRTENAQLRRRIADLSTGI